MRFTTTSQQPKMSVNYLTPLREARRRSTTVSFLGDDLTDCHTVARTPVKVENTYQLAPTEKLNGNLVEAVIGEVMEEALSHVTRYEPDSCKDLSTQLAESIKNRLKERLVNRYRLVCLVNIAQLANQCISMASRCLWNKDHDQYWSYQYKNHHFCAVATVYAVYLE